MISLTDHLLTSAPDFDAWFREGVDRARQGIKPSGDLWLFGEVRGRHGFKAVATPLLTPPNANVKLDKSIVPTYGLTLQHFRVVLDATTNEPRLSLNACPNAGHCVKVCVLDNGNGRYDSVQRGRLARVDLLARHPASFARILAWELVQAVSKHGEILFRPNVNSDVAWHRVLPSLTDGYVSGIMSYGYSKLPETLERDGWLGSSYRVAYSWNERSDRATVSAFVARGGAVAVVTARGKSAPVLEHLPFAYGTAAIVNADLTDEWMLTTRGAVVGDLSAKGKARALIGKSRFVVVPVAQRARRLSVVAA